MPIIKAVSSRATCGRTIGYISQDKKTSKDLMYGYNCNPQNAYNEFELVRRTWGKEDGRTYKHFSYDVHEKDCLMLNARHRDELLKENPDMDFKTATEQGKRMTLDLIMKQSKELVESCRAFDGHQIMIAVHQDKEAYHSHIVVNSVNFENGMKLQHSQKDLWQLKQKVNEIADRDGMHKAVKGRTYEGNIRENVVSNKRDTYEMLHRAEQGEARSWKQELTEKVFKASQTAESREQFVKLLSEQGIRTDWNNRKHIVFVDEAREQAGERLCKCRDNTIASNYNLPEIERKEVLEHGFENNRNRRIEREQQQPKREFKYSERRVEPVRETAINERSRTDGNRSIEPENSRKPDRTAAYRPTAAVEQMLGRLRSHTADGRREYEKDLRNSLRERQELLDRGSIAKRGMAECESRIAKLEQQLDRAVKYERKCNELEYKLEQTRHYDRSY